MLNLKVRAKNYQELQATLNNLCTTLFEFDEKGFFDDGQNEWIHRIPNYSLECSDVDGRPFETEDTYNTMQIPDVPSEDAKQAFADLVVKHEVVTMKSGGEIHLPAKSETKSETKPIKKKIKSKGKKRK